MGKSAGPGLRRSVPGCDLQCSETEEAPTFIFMEELRPRTCWGQAALKLCLDWRLRARRQGSQIRTELFLPPSPNIYTNREYGNDAYKQPMRKRLPAILTPK